MSVDGVIEKDNGPLIKPHNLQNEPEINTVILEQYK